MSAQGNNKDATATTEPTKISFCPFDQFFQLKSIKPSIFIDKYTQVPNILAPIALCIEQIELLISKDKAFQKYCELEWGSIQSLRLQILADFFKHGFDGSGDDGGSCIDGRLTSAWNWCQQLPQKDFFPLFRLSGFLGFDGREFQE